MKLLSLALKGAVASALILGIALTPVSKAGAAPYTPDMFVIPVSQAYVTSSDQTYTVQLGDTLSAIGHKFNISWQALYCENEKIIGPDPNILEIGEVLNLKAGKCSTSSSNHVNTTSDYTVTGTPEHIAMQLLDSIHEGQEYGCLNSVIMRESSWNIYAENPSGAYGIPQALPGSKMAGAWGSDWENSAYVQLYWMIKIYIPQTYGTPCGAWDHELSYGWY